MTDEPKKPVEWTLRADIDEMVADVVTRWHKDLEAAVIVTVGRPEAARAKGRVVWAALQKASPLHRALTKDGRDWAAPPDYLLIVALDVWDGADGAPPLPEPQRRALLDHELTHAHQDEETA